MPIFRRSLGVNNPNNRSLNASNIVDVSRISLPYPMVSGEISWDKKFEDFPSGSLTYTGILVSDIEGFERAFDYLGKQEAIAKIEGIDFYCQRPFSYERNHYTVWKGGVGEDVETLTITVGLVSVSEVKAKRKVLAKRLLSTGGLISVIDLANYVGVEYKGPNFFPEVNPDSAISLHEAVTANARLYGGYCRCGNGIELLGVDTGEVYSFRVGELLNVDGTNSLNPPPSYQDAELTWNRDPLEPDYELREPVVEVSIVQDLNPEKPPAVDYGAEGEGIILIAPWSSMFTNGGPTKTRTTTKSIDGKTISVEVEIYGYKFDSTNLDPDIDPPTLYSAEQYWQLCETTRTDYIYEDLSSPFYSVKTKDLSSPVEAYLTPIIHPDYSEFVSGDASSFSINNGLEYLVQEKTTGRKYFVLRREEGFELATAIEDLAVAVDAEEIRDLNQTINAYSWKMLPTEAIKSYILRNKRKLYRPYEKDLNDYEQNFVGNPFTLETLNYSSLPPRLKDAVPPDSEGSYIGYDGRVIFLVPDLNFVEPFVTTEEVYLKGSYFYAKTPDSLIKNEDNPNEQDTTGEETYTRISRKPIGKNRYEELVSEYSSQESGFERVYHTVKQSTILGQLPEGQSRKANWKDKTQKVRNRDVTRKTRYFLESDYVTESTPQGESIGFPTATSFEQAFEAAKVDLRIKTWQESNQTKKCAWYYPGVEPGDFIRTPRDLFGEVGNWRLLSVSFNLSVKGGAGSTVHVDQPLVLTEGTTFNTGLDIPREISFREEPDLRDRQPAEDDTRTSAGGVSKLGEIILSSATRRNIDPPELGEDPTPEE